MTTTIKNLYKTPDLYGDFLTQPLKAYNGYFSEKGTSWKKVALTIIHIATGIFAYPLFGSLALIGLGIKLCGVPSLKAHNEKEKISVSAVYVGVKNSEGYACESSSSLFFIPFNVEKSLQIRKATCDSDNQAILKAIDKLNSKFRRIYIDSYGMAQSGSGAITVDLKVIKENS